MLPRELQFELKPRRAIPWLRAGLSLVCLLVAAALLAWLVPRQQKLDSLRDELDQANRQLAESQRPVPASGPAPAWQGNAGQDGRLFQLQLDSRLLEIERCTEPKATVTRIVHDEALGNTTLEVLIADASVLAPMLECFGSSTDEARSWRLSSVEAVQAGADSRRVVLKRGQ